MGTKTGRLEPFIHFFKDFCDITLEMFICVLYCQFLFGWCLSLLLGNNAVINVNNSLINACGFFTFL